MNILMLGDIVGKIGRIAVKELLPRIKKEYNIDLTIANVENASSGKGISINGYDELYMSGVDIMTLGNHTWAKKEVYKLMEEKNNIIRPANYSNDVPGVGYLITNVKNKNILVINLIGRVDMGIASDCPFVKAKNIIANCKKEQKIDIVVVDFHAEATAEKIAMGYYLRNNATVVVGTHTHVQTADERIYNTGMGYITDLGMTGPKNSIIGMEYEVALKRFLTQIPEKYVCAEGEYMLNGVVFNLDETSNKVLSINRVSL